VLQYACPSGLKQLAAWRGFNLLGLPNNSRQEINDPRVWD